MKPFLSIIIPSLNEERFLPKLLENLIKQKEKNFEVIVVDGNSDDKTKNAVLGYINKMPLRFFQVKKRNVSFQRNYGAAKAYGKYLVFLDADSGVNCYFTRSLEKEIRSQKGLIFIPHVIPDKLNPETKIVFDFVNFLIEASQNTKKAIASGGSIFIEKDFFDNIGGFDESLFIAEDHNIVHNSRCWGVRAKFLNKIKVKISLRRMKKEGRLGLFYKYLYATALVLLKGKINKKIFDYEMGGQLYQKEKKANPRKIIKKYLTKAEKFFNELF